MSFILKILADSTGYDESEVYFAEKDDCYFSKRFGPVITRKIPDITFWIRPPVFLAIL
jgi:hypothetical protein